MSDVKKTYEPFEVHPVLGPCPVFYNDEYHYEWEELGFDIMMEHDWDVNKVDCENLLELTEPYYLSPIDGNEHWEDELPMDQDLCESSPDIHNALADLNKLIQKTPVGWKPTGRFMSAKVVRAMLAGVSYE